MWWNFIFFQAWGGGVYLLWNYCYAWCGGVLLAIGNSHVLYVGSVCLTWRAHGGIKCCVRFSVPRNPVKTLSPMWSSGKGSSSPVWSSGRGLVRVLYPLACVKQWGGERCFHLISARCEYSAPCAMHRRFYS